MFSQEEKIPDDILRPQSIRSLSKIYGVCVRTMKRWIAPFEKEVGEKNGRYYSVKQVRTIIQSLGLPATPLNES